MLKNTHKPGRRADRLKIRTLLAGGLVAATLVSACSVVQPSSEKARFDGQYFRTKVKPVDKKAAPADFTIVVNGVSASLDGAREAGRYEATKYCISKFGSSRVNWKVGPDTEPQKLPISDDKLTLAGSCMRP